MTHDTNKIAIMSSNKYKNKFYKLLTPFQKIKHQINKKYIINEITLNEVAQVLQACEKHDNTAKFEQTIVENNRNISKIFYKVMDITELMIKNQSSDLEQIKRAMTITDNLNLVRSEYLCELSIFLNDDFEIPENYKLTDEVIQKLLANQF